MAEPDSRCFSRTMLEQELEQERTLNSPSTPTSSTSTRAAFRDITDPAPTTSRPGSATVDGYAHYDREDQAENDTDRAADPSIHVEPTHLSRTFCDPERCAACWLETHDGHDIGTRRELGELASATCHDCEATWPQPSTGRGSGHAQTASLVRFERDSALLKLHACELLLTAAGVVPSQHGGVAGAVEFLLDEVRRLTAIRFSPPADSLERAALWERIRARDGEMVAAIDAAIAAAERRRARGKS